MDEPVTGVLGVISQVPTELPITGLLVLLVVIVYRAVSTHSWVPYQQVLDVRSDRDERLAEMKKYYEDREAEREAHKDEMIDEISTQRDQFKAAGEVKDQTIATLLAQNAELKELARTGVNLLSALPQPRAISDGHPHHTEESHGEG